MFKRSELETPEEQEARAQRNIKPAALVKAALIGAIIVYVVPAGGPWMSQEAFISVLGRVFSHNVILGLIGQLLLCFVYGAVIAAFIYRLSIGGGVVLGTGLSLPFYLLNFLVFGLSGWMPANEIHVFIAHFTFCLFFSALYKAMSLPRRRRADGRPLEI